MNDYEFYFDKIEKVLDNEEAHFLETERQHHTSWDNHILTLSTAAIGFCFTFLTVSCPNEQWLFFIGVGAFTLAIASAMLNYIFPQKGFKLIKEGNLQRRIQHNKARQRVRHLQQEVNAIGAEGDPAQIQAAREQCETDVESIYAQYDIKTEQTKLNQNNRIISTLNYVKTVTFLAGMILISVYASLNLEKLANGF